MPSPFIGSGQMPIAANLPRNPDTFVGRSLEDDQACLGLPSGESRHFRLFRIDALAGLI
jgi:hypothetical protein